MNILIGEVFKMDKLVLSVPEIAKLLDLSTATVYLMVRNNQIPYKKLRGKIVFHRETIEQWLAAPTASWRSDRL